MAENLLDMEVRGMPKGDGDGQGEEVEEGRGMMVGGIHVGWALS
jgi:hypothetical protein